MFKTLAEEVRAKELANEDPATVVYKATKHTLTETARLLRNVFRKPPRVPNQQLDSQRKFIALSLFSASRKAFCVFLHCVRVFYCTLDMQGILKWCIPFLYHSAYFGMFL